MSLTLTLSLALTQLPGGAWDDPIVGPSLAVDSGVRAVETSDIDGDGQNDLVVPLSWLDSADAVALSGADLSVLHFLDAGIAEDVQTWQVASIGDLSADGVAEIMLTTQRPGSGGALAPTVELFDGATGAHLDTVPAPRGYTSFGRALAGGRDLDGDRIPEILITNPSEGLLLGQPAHGVVFVYSGATRRLLHTIALDRKYGVDGFGQDLCFIADRDGDQLPDLAVGADDRKVGTRGGVFLVSSATGKVLQAFDHPEDELGVAVESAGDVDRDGHDDLLVVGHSADAGHEYAWRIYSGARGDQIVGGFGTALPLGDIDRDGTLDFYVQDRYPARRLISAPDRRVIRDFAASARPIPWTGFRTADGGHAYLAAASGGPTLHRFRPWIAVDDHFVDAASGDSVQFTLSFPSSAALAEYRVLGSARGLGTFEPPVGVPVPLLPDLWTNKSWRGDYGPILNAVNLHGQLDANAQATGTLQFPAGSLAAYVGRPLHFCAVALDAQGAPAWSSAPVLVGVRP